MHLTTLWRQNIQSARTKLKESVQYVPGTLLHKRPMNSFPVAIRGHADTNGKREAAWWVPSQTFLSERASKGTTRREERSLARALIQPRGENQPQEEVPLLSDFFSFLFLIETTEKHGAVGFPGHLHGDGERGIDQRYSSSLGTPGSPSVVGFTEKQECRTSLSNYALPTRILKSLRLICSFAWVCLAFQDSLQCYAVIHDSVHWSISA